MSCAKRFFYFHTHTRAQTFVFFFLFVAHLLNFVLMEAVRVRPVLNCASQTLWRTPSYWDGYINGQTDTRPHILTHFCHAKDLCEAMRSNGYKWWTFMTTTSLTMTLPLFQIADGLHTLNAIKTLYFMWRNKNKRQCRRRQQPAAKNTTTNTMKNELHTSLQRRWFAGCARNDTHAHTQTLCVCVMMMERNKQINWFIK